MLNFFLVGIVAKLCPIFYAFNTYKSILMYNIYVQVSIVYHRAYWPKWYLVMLVTFTSGVLAPA